MEAGDGEVSSEGAPGTGPRSAFIKIICEPSACTVLIMGGPVGSWVPKGILWQEDGRGGGSVGDSGKGMYTLQALSLREGSPQQSELRPAVLSSGPGQRGR